MNLPRNNNANPSCEGFEKRSWTDDLVLETWSPEMGDRDLFFMARAVDQAILAAEQGETPVGAALVCQNRIIARDHNRRETLGDPTAHAEMLVLKQAARLYPSWRIEDAELYVTLEPCVMCAGAILQARVQRVVYAAKDTKGGAVESLFQLLNDPRLNWRAETLQGVLQDQSVEILQSFFREKRRGKNSG